MSDELWETCPDCMGYLHGPEGWSIPGALASVGIERGKSTYEMARLYFADYHQKGHKHER